jgi:transposase
MMESGDIWSQNNLHQTGRYLTAFQRKLLQSSLRDVNLGEHQRQRISIMLLADEGKSQTEICQDLGCSQGTARHWIMMARTGQAHHWQEQPVGRPKLVNEEYIERLKEIINHSPRDLGYPFRRWTAGWLSKHLTKEFGIEVSTRHINRLLKELGLSTRLQSSRSSNIVTSKRIAITDLSGSCNQETQELLSLQAFESRGY